MKLPIEFSAINLTPRFPILQRCVSDQYNSPGDSNKNNAGSIEPDGPLRRPIPSSWNDGKESDGWARISTKSPALPPLYPGSNRPSTEFLLIT
ncbi:hypothetical protein QQ045_012314 [Rhodiola kirilowii]